VLTICCMPSLSPSYSQAMLLCLPVSALVHGLHAEVEYRTRVWRTSIMSFSVVFINGQTSGYSTPARVKTPGLKVAVAALLAFIALRRRACATPPFYHFSQLILRAHSAPAALRRCRAWRGDSSASSWFGARRAVSLVCETLATATRVDATGTLMRNGASSVPGGWWAAGLSRGMDE